jgi:hypothetical protein
MAATYLTLLDVAKIKGSDMVTGLIEENLLVAPEAKVLPARTITGTNFKTLIRKNFPKPAFRATNEGTDPVASSYENKNVECYYLDGQLEMDVATATATDQGEGFALALEADGVMQGALQKIGTQVWYGTNTTFGGDAKGFPGAVSIVDSSLVYDAGGTTDSVCASVYGLKLGEKWATLVFGNGNVFQMGQWVKQFVTRNSKEYQAWKNALQGWIGVQWVNKYAVGRIKKLTTDSGKGLTDAVVANWLAKFPVGVRPDVLFASRRSLMQLQLSRSVTIFADAAARQSGQQGRSTMTIAAPQPTESNGIPIVPTDSLLETETLAL